MMKQFLLCIFFWVAAALSGFSQAKPDPDFHLYILAGQSNMAGRGKLTETYTPPRDSGVWMLDASLDWVPARHPVHFDKPKVAGVGPGLSFGQEMYRAAHSKIRIGLIPCAVGGTAIEKWTPGAYDAATNTHPYDDAVQRIKAAMQAGVIKGVIWHQGEANSNPQSAARYLPQLESLIQRFRQLTGNEKLPFVAGELGYFRPKYETVNQVLRQLPKRVSITGVATAESLSHKGDTTHFDSESAILLGKRFAKQMLLLQQGGDQTQTSDEVVIRGKIPVYVRPGEAPEVLRAVTDLLRDLQKVFGQPSVLVSKMPATGPVIVVATGDRLKSRHPGVKGWEAHQLYVEGGRIVLNGADTRGTIYAIYTLSEMLGVTPLWFWTSEQPKRIEALSLAGDFSRVFKSPDIKYRTWFPNDTDLLTPWQKRSEENFDALFESMLRLKLNTIEGGIAEANSFDGRYKLGRQAAAAQSRGLVNTGHHMLIFGSSYNNWGQYWKEVRRMPVPELKIANREALSDFWGYHIDLAKKNNLEVIWLVGFRGNRDIPFWEFFPDAPADAQSRAQVIAEMVKLQIDLLKKKTGDPHPPMRMTLYNEMTTLVAEGLLKIPEEPSLIRNFVAARRDHFPAKDIYGHSFSSSEPTGYYMNFQFTSTGSHLVQAEGPRKMEQNYRIVDSLSKGQLMFSVVNAGNIREHLLELSANAEMMWDFKNFRPGQFLERFSATYFGEAHAADIAVLYQDFLNSYWCQKKGDIPGFERQYIFQDMRYARAAEMIIGDLEKGIYNLNPLDNHPLDNPDKGSVGYFRVIPQDNGVNNQIEAMLKGTNASIEELKRITLKADNIFEDPLLKGKIFFDDNLRGQATIMLHLNRMLNDLVRSYQIRDNQQDKKRYLKRGLEELQLVQQRLRQSEHGKFEEWYVSENKFGLGKIEQRMKSLLAKPVL